MDLTKWPRLLVIGNPITREQANEILIRTDDWWISTNDREWKRSVESLLAEFGRPSDESKWNEQEAWNESIGVLDLSYLHNQRIASSWIGGSHGWCDWDGTIQSRNYNIGKWPSAEEVTLDWEKIASAFPYLDLRAQLVPDEGEALKPAIEWHVSSGKVEVVDEPTELLARPTDPQFLALLTLKGEQGVSLGRLREALAQVTK